MQLTAAPRNAGISRWLLSVMLIGSLALLVVVPFLMIVVTSFSTDVPFSGTHTASATLVNYATLWTPEFGTAMGAGCGFARAARWCAGPPKANRR